MDRLQWDSFDWRLSDGDLINVTIDHSVASGNAVDFVLEAGPLINWWKAILLPDGQWIWTQDARTRDSATVAVSQLHGDLQLGKAKVLGLHQGVYLLGSLEQLQAGDRVTFTWVRDGAPWRNDSWLTQVIDAPFIQGRGHWVKPGSQFNCTINVTNRGDPWYPGARYKLGSWNPQDNLTWGLGRVDLDSWLADVGPSPRGAAVDFTVTAPSAEGEYRFSWRMVQEGVEWFGEWTDFGEYIGFTFHPGKVVVSAVQPTPIIPMSSTKPDDTPPPPPPPPPTSGDLTVSMPTSATAQTPDAWYIFSGMAYDPALNTLTGKGPAKVVSVKNISPYSFSLLHQDAQGRQTPTINLNSGELTSVSFQGLEVEGEWTAQFIGKREDAPLSLAITVSWNI